MTINTARVAIKGYDSFQFYWTLGASCPLLVEESKEALRLDVGETLSQLEKTIGSVCGNLVAVDIESRLYIKPSESFGSKEKKWVL
jgi:hypothetical protein